MEQLIESFIKHLAAIKGLDETECLEEWTKWKGVDYAAMSFTQLRALCKEKNLKSIGKKVELVERLKNADKQLNESVFKFYQNPATGHYIQTATQLVIDKERMVVIGRQVESGAVAKLTREDVEYCNLNKLPWDRECVAVCLDRDVDEEVACANVDAAAGEEDDVESDIASD